MGAIVIRDLVRFHTEAAQESEAIGLSGARISWVVKDAITLAGELRELANEIERKDQIRLAFELGYKK